MSRMVFRRAQEIDMKAIIDMCRESLLKAYGEMMEPGKIMPWAAGGDDVEKYVRGNWPNMMVAWQGEKLAGLVSAVNGHIDLLWVDETFRHSGVGQNLITETEQWLARKYSNITVECVNDDMVNFFAKRGYEYQREFIDGLTGVKKTIMGSPVELLCKD